MKASARTCAPIQSGRLCVQRRLGVGVVGGAHHRDEDLRRPDLAGAGVDQIDGLAGVIDEHALAGGMGLAHRRRQPALPGAVQLAPAAVAIAVRLALPVLLPQQHQRDAGPAQLVMDVGPIGLGLAPLALLAAVAGIQHRLQHPVGQRRRQRPAQARRRGPLQGQRDGAARQAQRAGDLPVAGAAFVLQAQDLAYASHRHSLGWHRSPARHCLTSRAPSTAQRSSACHPSRGGRLQIGMAEIKSESVADFIPELVADFARNE